MTVLLSIKPEFAEKIFNGTKKFEFRKSIFKNTDVKKVVVPQKIIILPPPIRELILSLQNSPLLAGY